MLALTLDPGTSGRGLTVVGKLAKKYLKGDLTLVKDPDNQYVCIRLARKSLCVDQMLIRATEYGFDLTVSDFDQC